MPPLLIAVLEVASVFAAFWMTRALPSTGRKWRLRMAAVILVFILAAGLAEDSRAAAIAGEYSVYLGIPAALVYWFAKKRAGVAVSGSRRAGPGRPGQRR